MLETKVSQPDQDSRDFADALRKTSQHTWHWVYWSEPPETQVGSLRRCPAPVVVIASCWIRNQVLFFGESHQFHPVSCIGFFEGVDCLGNFYHTWYRIPIFNHFVEVCWLCLNVSEFQVSQTAVLGIGGPQHSLSLWLRYLPSETKCHCSLCQNLSGS